jgi:anti-anti-sigma factor
MAMTGNSVLQVGRTPDGYCLKIQGSGTMNQSPAAREFVIRSLDGGVASLVVDLSRCTYLDSTFLGCLVELHRRFNRQKPPRLFVAADAVKTKQLLYPTRMDMVLKILSTVPPCIGDCIPLPIPTANDKVAFTRHVMECHRRLAEIEGPDQAKFVLIAEQMARELGSIAPG